jgi:hypothetical protein
VRLHSCNRGLARITNRRDIISSGMVWWCEGEGRCCQSKQAYVSQACLRRHSRMAAELTSFPVHQFDSTYLPNLPNRHLSECHNHRSKTGAAPE